MITYDRCPKCAEVVWPIAQRVQYSAFLSQYTTGFLGDVRKNERYGVPEQWLEERRHGSKQEQNEASTLVHGPNAIAGSRKKKPCSRFPTLGFHGFGKMRERWGESAGVFNGYRNKRTVVRRKCVRVEGSRACVNHENVGRHRFGETLDVLYSILAASAEATSRLPLFSVFSRPTSCHPTSRLSP